MDSNAVMKKNESIQDVKVNDDTPVSSIGQVNATLPSEATVLATASKHRAQTGPAIVSAETEPTVTKGIEPQPSQQEKQEAKTKTAEMLNITERSLPGDPMLYIQRLQGDVIASSERRKGYLNFEIERNQPTLMNIQDTSSIFLLSSEVPRWFKFTTLQNEAQSPESIDHHFLANLGEIDSVKQSIELFNPSTMVVRYELLDVINGQQIWNPNHMKDSVLDIRQVVSTTNDFTFTARFAESRLFSTLRLWLAVDNVLYKIPEKITTNAYMSPSRIESAFSLMPHFKDEGVHPYLAAVARSVPWFTERMEELYATHPFDVSERVVNSLYSKKTASVIQLFTDQYSTACANITASRMLSNQLTTQELVDRYQANMLDRDYLEITSNPTQEVSLMYSPNETERNLVMYLLIVSRSARATVMQRWNEVLRSTNALRLKPFSSVWNPQNTTADLWSSALYRNFSDLVEQGAQVSPEQYLLYETFSANYRFEINMPAIPSSFAMLIDVCCVILWFQVSPRIASHVSYQLGFRLCKALQALFPAQYDQFILTNGYIRKQGSSNRSQITVAGNQITPDMARQGWVYSIFLPPLSTPRDKAMKPFYDIVAKIRELCVPQTSPIVLTRKRDAKYPYYRSDFVANQSWERIYLADGAFNNQDTDWQIRIRKTINFMLEVIHVVNTSSPTAQRVIPTSSILQIQTIFNNISALASTSALPFQATMANYQQTLMNSFAFVRDEYNPNNVHVPPPQLVMLPNDANSNQMGVPVQEISTVTLPFALPLAYILLLEGEFTRGNDLSETARANMPSQMPAVKEEILSIKGEELESLYSGLVRIARRFGIGMFLVSSLVDESDPNNPLSPLASTFKHIMRMANWAHLVKAIFEHIDQDFSDYFVEALATNTGAYDGRVISRALGFIDPDTMKPAVKQPTNTIYGRQFEFIDTSGKEILDIVSRVTIKPSSPFLTMSQGLYIGRFLVDELSPYHAGLEKQWNVVNVSDVTFGNIRYKEGQACVIRVKSGNNTSEFLLPYFEQNTRLMIQMENLTSIPRSHLDTFARAILHGCLAVKVLNVKVNFAIDDQPSRTIDYSQVPSIREMVTLLSAKNDTILDQRFLSTNYATNYSSNSFVIPKYIQWTSAMHNVDKNLFAAVLQSSIGPAPNTVLPLGIQLEAGRIDGRYTSKTSDGRDKLDLDCININNAFIAIGREIYSEENRPRLHYIVSSALK